MKSLFLSPFDEMSVLVCCVCSGGLSVQRSQSLPEPYKNALRDQLVVINEKKITHSYLHWSFHQDPNSHQTLQPPCGGSWDQLGVAVACRP